MDKYQNFGTLSEEGNSPPHANAADNTLEIRSADEKYQSNLLMRMEELHIGSIFRHILSIHTIQVFPSPIINNATHGAQQATPVPVPTHYVPTACYCRSPIVSNYACTNIEDDFSHCLLPLGLERPSGGPNDNEVRKLEARRWQQSRTPRHTQEAPMSRTHICNVTSSGSAAGNPSCLGGGTLVLG